MNTQGTPIANPTIEDFAPNTNTEAETEDSHDLIDTIPFRINRNIKNYRYAYKYDSTVNSVINNLIVIANSEYDIMPDSEEYNEAAEHIKEKFSDWDMPKFINTFIKTNMVDGAAFINRYVDNGSVKLKYLANDGITYKWLVIRDPESDDIIEYVQKIDKKSLPSNWKTAKFEDLENYEETEFDVTIRFQPEEIIYTRYMEDDGKGVSALYPILDLVDIKGKLELFMLLAGHKAGAFLGVQVGNKDVDSATVDSGYVSNIMNWFTANKKKDVIAFPYGVEPKEIGSTNLPDYVTYVKFLQSEIRNAILTPDSKFSAVSSNRATATEQLNTSTGYQGFIGFIQDFICWIVNHEIIDKELELFDKKAIGKVKLVYINEDLDKETTLAEIGNTLKNLYPDLNAELVIKTYFPRFGRALDKAKRMYGAAWEKHFDKDLGKMDELAVGGTDWNKPGMNNYNRNQQQASDAAKQQKQQQQINQQNKGGGVNGSK